MVVIPARSPEIWSGTLLSLTGLASMLQMFNFAAVTPHLVDLTLASSSFGQGFSLALIYGLTAPSHLMSWIRSTFSRYKEKSLRMIISIPSPTNPITRAVSKPRYNFIYFRFFCLLIRPLVSL
jgi:hypothetical protein